MMRWKSFGFRDTSGTGLYSTETRKTIAHCFSSSSPFRNHYLKPCREKKNLNQPCVKCRSYLIFGMGGAVDGWKVAWMAFMPFCRLMDMDAFPFWLSYIICHDFFCGYLDSYYQGWNWNIYHFLYKFNLVLLKLYSIICDAILFECMACWRADSRTILGPATQKSEIHPKKKC